MDTNTNNKSTDEGHGREKEDYEKIEKVAAEGANLTYSSKPSTSQHSQNPGEMKEITADGSRKENGHANAIEADNGELTGFTGYIVPSDDNDDDDDESMEITDYNHDVDIDEGDEIIETRPGEVFNPEKEQHMHCEESKNDKYTSDEESEEEDHHNELARDQYYDPEKDDDEQSHRSDMPDDDKEQMPNTSDSDKTMMGTRATEVTHQMTQENKQMGKSNLKIMKMQTKQISTIIKRGDIPFLFKY